MPPFDVTNVSRLVFPVERVGAVSLGHLTDVGHVTAPLVSVSSRVNTNAPVAGGLENVKVLVAFAIVFVK